MELKKGYTLLFNVISDAIEEVEEVMRKSQETMRKSEKLLLTLKKAQQEVEERYINEDE